MINGETYKTLDDLNNLCCNNNHYYMIGDLMPGRGAGGVLGQIHMELNELKLLNFVESVSVGKPLTVDYGNNLIIIEAYRITNFGKKFLEKNPPPQICY